MRIAIIPIKELESAKLRLGYILSTEKRSELSHAMLERTLACVTRSLIDRVELVCSSPESVDDFLDSSNKISVVKESIFHGGVNSAMADGLRAAKSDFRISELLLLPSDLPLVSTAALDKVIDYLRNFDLVISPSDKRDGTNLLAFKGSDFSIALHYDDDSFRKHLSEANAKSLNYLVLDNPEFLHDLDSEDDLSYLMKHYNVGDFSDLIQKIRGT